ncbi:MAG: DUF131 domain-containing protein [Candidatus Altiarchaeota archaeon]
MDAGILIPVGIILILLGVLALVGGILFASKGASNVRGGGVIFLGPVPLVFGTDRQSAYAVAILTLLLMILYYLLIRR